MIVRRYAARYVASRGELTVVESKLLKHLGACRTPAMGGRAVKCRHCGSRRFFTCNSCRNRHCPSCGGAARAQWLEDRQRDLLPVTYFHLVFTLPDTLRDLALYNKSVVYGLLFRAASQTLLELAADEKHLGARLGLLIVLHTWGQRLQHHPHVHCVVPAGGLSPDGRRWVSSEPGYLLPVKVLSAKFRGKFLALLKQAYRDGLRLPPALAKLSDERTFNRWLTPLYKRDWVVYAKRPFGGPAQVLAYLARYTHRVAISNGRLASLEGDRVTFRYKDYADGNRQKTTTMRAVKFLGRLLLHALPNGFTRIRYYGIWSNRHRRELLPQCRALIELQREVPPWEQPPEPRFGPAEFPGEDASEELAVILAVLPEIPCPACGHRSLTLVDYPRPTLPEILATPWTFDSS